MIIRNSATISFEKEERHGKGRHFVSRFMEAGLAGYKDQGGKVILIRKEALDRFVQSMVGCPVIIKHVDVTDDNVKDLADGYVSRVWFNEPDGWYYCEGVVQGDDVETLIEEKNWSVSCSYIVTEKDEKGGMYHGIEYDEEVLNGDFAHLAIVPNPRYREANIVLNSIEMEENSMLNLFNRKKIRNSEEKEEKMDKRKAIDKIGGILNGKVDEEVWRTIVGIIEKIAYSESEDKKDNDSDLEDDDKEKENACHKNESDKEDEKKPEEEKKKNEDEEKEKEEMKNKMRNSSDFEEIKSIRNSFREIEEVISFVPEPERLKRGMKY